jgi:hypothetical protein
VLAEAGSIIDCLNSKKNAYSGFVAVFMIYSILLQAVASEQSAHVVL